MHQGRYRKMCYLLKKSSGSYICNLGALVFLSSTILWGKIYLIHSVQFSSVIQSCLTLWNPWTAATKPPCSSPTPRVYSNTCPLIWWHHPTISSSVVPFSSHLPSFPASRSFPMSQLFTSGGQNIGVSASESVLPVKIQDWFPLGWTSWISLQSKELSRAFSNTTI